MSKKLTFIDLFAGIGGFHIALKSVGMNCVFTCEIDKYARETYFENFKEPYLKDKNLFPEDIWSIDFKKIPNFDILKSLALDHKNTITFGISGSGPSVFCLTKGKETAHKLEQSFTALMQDRKMAFDCFIDRIKR